MRAGRALRVSLRCFLSTEPDLAAPKLVQESNSPLFLTDTFHHIQQLNSSGLSRSQSIAIVDCLQTIADQEFSESEAVPRLQIMQSFSSADAAQKEHHLSSLQEAFLSSAKVAIENEKLNQQIALANERCRSDLARLRSDVLSVLSTHKEANRELEQAIDVELHRIRGSLTLADGSFRANMESAKFKSLALFTVMLASGFFAVSLQRRSALQK